MNDLDYWSECVKDGVIDANVEATESEITIIAESVREGHMVILEDVQKTQKDESAAMTDTIKRPHKFKKAVFDVDGPNRDVYAQIEPLIFCEYCALTGPLSNKGESARVFLLIAAKGCPCSPIKEKICRTCDGEGKLKLGWKGEPHEYTEKCADCNGTGKT